MRRCHRIKRLLHPLLVVAFLAVAVRALQADRPNVVLIMADDIGTECFSLYGGTSYATPHLDALAAGGMRFTNCHAQPLCTPSRVKIMTGRSNLRNYSGFSVLEREEKTIGELMREAGYATCVVGKWQLLAAEHYGELAGSGTHPRDAGFESWCLWQVEKLGSRYWGPLIDRDGELVQFEKNRYGPDVFCEYLDAFMEQNRDRPFFVYYPMALVHDPFVPTPASADPEAEKGKRHFADMVSYMDRVVGRIVARLDALGLRERTLVIFTSDNGTSRAITSQTTAGPVRGAKGRTTHAGTHVPLIASLPGVIPEGAECDDLVDFSDFVPTLAEACGFDLPADRPLDGRTFWPRLLGKPGTPREWIYCYYNPRPGHERFPERQFIFDKRWKLYGDGRLFDLRIDPGEEHPIAADNADEEARAARARLHAARQTLPARPTMIGSTPDTAPEPAR